MATLEAKRSTALAADRSVMTPAGRLPAARERALREHRIVAPFLGDYEADVFRTLRTLVLRRLAERGAKTLGICSTRKGEGKSLVAMNLAMSLALDVNHTVLLVELDLRWPQLHKCLGVTVKKGLIDVLNGEATISDCLVRMGFERLTVLPARASLSRSSETVASPAMATLAGELRERYQDRLILYDLPPILLTDDFLAFMHHLDAWLLVVGDGKSVKADIERALSLTDRQKLIGTVLNASTASVREPAYYDSSH